MRLFAVAIAALCCLFWVGCSKEARESRVLARAERHFEQGAYEAAEKEYLEIRRSNPGNLTAVVKLGAIYHHQGARFKALPLLLIARTVAPTNLEARLHFAMALEETGLGKEARAEAAAILRQDAQNGDALVLLARTANGAEQLADVESRLAAYRLKQGDTSWSWLTQASLGQKRGNASAAEAALRRAIATDAKCCLAHLALAQFAYAHTNLVEAGREFKAAAELSSPRDPAQLSYAEFLLATDQQAAGRQALQTALTQAPDLESAQLLLARLARQQNQPEQALAQLKQVLARDAGNPEARLLRAEIELARQQPEEAAQDLAVLLKSLTDFSGRWHEYVKLATRAWQPKSPAGTAANTDASADANEVRATLLAFYPAAPRAYFLLAETLASTGKPEQARQLLAEALRLNAGYVEAQVALARLGPNGDQDAARAIRALRELAAELQARGASLEKALGNTPTGLAADLTKVRNQETMVWLNLAEALLQHGDANEARDTLQALAKAAPHDPSVFYGLGMVWRQLKHDAEARAAFEQVLRLDPGSAQAVSQLTDLDLAQAKRADALQRVQACLQKNPESAVLQYLEGYILFADSGRWPEAETALRKALQLDDNYTLAYELLVKLWVAQKQLPKAAEELAKRLEKRPGEVRATMLLAQLKRELGQPAEARGLYEKVLAVRPDFLPAMDALALLYVDNFGEVEKAFTLAQKALSFEPGNPFLADTLGWIHYHRGEYPQALSWLQQSAVKLAGVPAVQYHLGLTYQKLNRPAEARAALQTALNSPASFIGRPEAERVLKELP